MGVILGINCGGGGNQYFAADDETGEIFVNDKVAVENLPSCVADQYEVRFGNFVQWIEKQATKFNRGDVTVVVARGPVLKPDNNGQPNNFGIYSVNDAVIQAVETGNLFTRHGSEHSCRVANEYVSDTGIPVIFADPISGQRLPEHFQLSGHPKVAERRALGHWLSVHGRMLALYGDDWVTKKIIACHFGTGITIAAFDRGNLVNVNDANAGGAFSDTRAGGLPTEQFLDYIVGQMWGRRALPDHQAAAQLIKDELQSKCGLAGYLGIKTLEELESMLTPSNARANVVFQAMLEQILEEIVARFANLRGEVDKVILTGGMANSDYLVNHITSGLFRIIPEEKFERMPGSCEPQRMISAAQEFLGGAKPIEYGAKMSVCVE